MVCVPARLARILFERLFEHRLRGGAVALRQVEPSQFSLDGGVRRKCMLERFQWFLGAGRIVVGQLRPREQ